MDFHALLREERAKARRKGKERDKPTPQPPVNASQATLASAPPSFSLTPRQFQAKDLPSFSVGGIPSIHYVADFLTDADEAAILQQVYHLPRSHPKWTHLSCRSLQCWGGEPRESQDGSFTPEPLPPFLVQLGQQLVRCGAFPAEGPPNHVLINEYTPGQGILPHTDGPWYRPRTATLSLGSDAVMSFESKLASHEIGSPNLSSDKLVKESLLLRRKCLVLFTGQAYTGFTHAITTDENEMKRLRDAGLCNDDTSGPLQTGKTRISLTFRHVDTKAPKGR
ncbi:unnamed protein product [Chrysoparadoxa australica]